MNSAKFFARFAAMLVCVASATSFAATHPLNQPMGLAVDAKGNLYVANYGANQILVYNPLHQQLTSRTITTNINSPLQPVIDAEGNLWVANLTSGTTNLENFTEYASGKQINTDYLLSNIFQIQSFAVDGVGDIWSLASDGNGQPFVGAADGPSVYTNGIIDTFFVQNGSYTAVAAHGPWIAFGSATSASWELVGALLGASPDLHFFGSSGDPGQGVLAMTFDNNNDLYYATNEGLGVSGVWFVNIPVAAAPSLNVNVGYTVSGIAADCVHGLLYVSNASTNKIEIYSTSTWLLVGTIQ